ncbi:hypothetical protein SAMN05216376_1277 [Mameliella alba]|uniref:hypothetical protein n=1 Tax=Mameliella alba TaxID=561184 RepID=UPI00088DF17B|nr:hypothetical protein [Mameliella alba]OWV40505.1 hypothetical protein CDZ96_25885 [Mameliella alba]PTR33235.1 hypothetical protein LX94_05101 [Mameliella alba]GGF85821.1 hypothetical protein GCM10011319_52050 [Mameliella alba]SDE32525.1 hypothetical protein SAMN05216376_1277 [Mameliella alba]
MPKDVFFPSPSAEFLVAHCSALDNATFILGGAAAQKRFRRLLDDVTASPLLTRRANRELDAIEDLLSLRYVHDDERVEAECFAAIDPCSPIVEDICALLEGLQSARAQEVLLP